MNFLLFHAHIIHRDIDHRGGIFVEVVCGLRRNLLLVGLSGIILRHRLVNHALG